MTVGAILAGGASRRFGSPKALARIGGSAMISRVAAAHRGAFARSVVITEAPALFADLRLPTTPDLRSGEGPLGGVQAALAWAAAEGGEGACVTPCDMPFLTAALLRLLAESAAPGIEAVVIERKARGGFSPLPGWYAAGARFRAEETLRRGETALHHFVARLSRVTVVPLAAVREVGPPERLLLNVNTRMDLNTAQRLASDDE